MEIDRDQATGLPAGLVERRAGRCESVRAATTTWRCCCCRRRLSTRDATSTDAGGVKNAAVTSRLFLFPRALFPPDADPSSPASVCTWIRAYRRAPLIFLPKKKGGERRKEKRKREEKSVLTALLLRDSDSLTAAARGLRVLTTHAHAPVVTETAVAPDLPQPVKVLTDLEVQTVREHLGKTTCRQVSHHPDTKSTRRSSPPLVAQDPPAPADSALPLQPRPVGSRCHTPRPTPLLRTLVPNGCCVAHPLASGKPLQKPPLRRVRSPPLAAPPPVAGSGASPASTRGRCHRSCGAGGFSPASTCRPCCPSVCSGTSPGS